MAFTFHPQRGTEVRAAANHSLVDKQKIVNIRATLNFCLSKELQLMFPETVPVSRPLK